MTVTINLQARHLAIAVVAVAAVVFTVWWTAPALSQTAGPGPVASYAVVARADNPVDALAASAVAGQLGAPVYLTPNDRLDEQAQQGLADTYPDVVVVAGGPVALSPQVEEEIGELLPDAQVRRVGGAGRTETARLINQLPGELGIIRPVLAGATVAGDVGIDGQLTVAGTDVTAAIAALSARVDSLEADNAELTGRVATLEATLEGVTRTTVEGRDTLRFEAMNLQLVNGTGTTNGTPNGQGNLIIGYNTPRSNTVAADRAGSHYMIVGDGHHWTSHGGMVAGLHNTATGEWASVFAGLYNSASGFATSVSGGTSNNASGNQASVSGGWSNTASGKYASVSGGWSNDASGYQASVSGGYGNIASGGIASVSGGEGNTASYSYASVSGGFDNTASGKYASVSGGEGNTASGHYASVTSGRDNTASGDYASVAGGKYGSVSDDYDSRIGNTDFPD